MRRFAIALALLAGTATADAPKDPYAAWRAPIAKIVGGAYDGAVFAQLGDLSDLGSRLTGTPGYAKSADWVAAQLKAAGAQNVHLEKFGIKHGWQRGTARFVANGRALHIESLGWTPSTAGTVRAPLVRVKLDAVPKNLKGKIAIFDVSEIPQGPGAWKVVRKAIAELKTSGATAFIGAFVAPNNVLIGAGDAYGPEQLMPLPAAVVGLEDGKWLFKQVERGPVTVELALSNTVTGPVQVPNVVGELKGQTDEWIVIGAHLDAWDFATGSQDNGSGVVHVIQTARLLAAAGPLKRSVRFVLWGGEEQGLLGSRAYVTAHAGELDKVAAYVNTDNGAGHVKGWKVEKRADVQTALAPIADKLLANLGAATVDMTLTNDTDHFMFLQAGVPAIDLLVDMTGYWPIHHTVGDTIDKVEPHALASGLAVVAVTAYALAQAADRTPRLDRKALEPLFKPDGLDELLVADGIWK